MTTATSVRQVHTRFAGKVEHQGGTTTVHALVLNESDTSARWQLFSAHGEPHLDVPTAAGLQIGSPTSFAAFDAALAAFLHAPGVYRVDDAEAAMDVLAGTNPAQVKLYDATVRVFTDAMFDPRPILAAVGGTVAGRANGSMSLQDSLRWEVVPDQSVRVPATALVTTTAPGKPVEFGEGNLYWPRTIFGVPDVDTLRTLRGHTNVRIVGPPGSGKTTLPRAAFGDDLTYVQGSADLTASALYGQWLPASPGSDSEFVWVDGPLTVAAKTGGVFLLDEANRAPAETTAALLSIADDRRTLVISGRPGETVVRAADGFMLIITYNEDDQGVYPMSQALLRRCPFQIRVDTDLDIAGSAGVHQDLITIAENARTASLEHFELTSIQLWWPRMADLMAANTVLKLLGTESAAGVLLSACPVAEHDRFAGIVQSVFGHPVAEVELGPAI